MSMVEAERLAAEQPDPKAWDQLDDVAREALRSFNVFAEHFLLRRPVPLAPGCGRARRRGPAGSRAALVPRVEHAAWVGEVDVVQAVRVMLGAYGMSVSSHCVGRAGIAADQLINGRVTFGSAYGDIRQAEQRGASWCRRRLGVPAREATRGRGDRLSQSHSNRSCRRSPRRPANATGSRSASDRGAIANVIQTTTSIVLRRTIAG